jgi:hypothetical protein
VRRADLVVDGWLGLDWRMRTLTVYRRAGEALELIATLQSGDAVESPLLPGFSCPLERIFSNASSPVRNPGNRSSSNRLLSRQVRANWPAATPAQASTAA